MIKQISYNIITMLMLIVFIAASAGLSIYIHKCACEQRIIATLFVEHKCHNEQASSCCSTKEVSEFELLDSDAGCDCKTEHFTIKVSDLFNSTNPIEINQKKVIFTVSQFINLDNNLAYSENFNSDKNLYIPDDSPPVKPVGRILVHFLHQSKTPALLA